MSLNDASRHFFKINIQLQDNSAALRFESSFQSLLDCY